MRQKIVSTARKSDNRKLTPLTNLTFCAHKDSSPCLVIGLRHNLDELAERTLCVVGKLVAILVRSSNAPRDPIVHSRPGWLLQLPGMASSKLARAFCRGCPVYTCICWFQQAHHHGLTDLLRMIPPLGQTTVTRTRARTRLTGRIENVVTQRQTLLPPQPCIQIIICTMHHMF